MHSFDIVGAIFLFLLIGPMVFSAAQQDDDGEYSDAP